MIRIANPLPQVLSHYQDELEATLTRCGIEAGRIVTHPVEGLAGPMGRPRMLINALTNARRNAETEDSALQIWPSVGLWDFLLWNSSTSRNSVIFHDPTPIRRQFGFDSLSKSVARITGGARSPRVIAHSDEALTVAKFLLPRYEILKVLHPVMRIPGSLVREKNNEVVVAGQYKPERDLEMLAAIGPKLSAKGLRPTIYGRGWPTGIPGWQIVDGYIAESRLQRALASARVVVVPYRNYFQSNIAVRALELGTLSVLKSSSFSRDLFGKDDRLDVGDFTSTGEVIAGIIRAADMANESQQFLDDYERRVDASWSGFVHAENTIKAK